MNPMLISLIAGAVMGQKKASEDHRNYQEQQRIEAAKQKFSSFTGQRGQTLGRPNSSNTMMQSLIAAAMMGKQLQNMGGADPNAGGGSTLLGNVPQTSGPMGGGAGARPMPGEADNRNFYA